MVAISGSRKQNDSVKRRPEDKLTEKLNMLETHILRIEANQPLIEEELKSMIDSKGCLSPRLSNTGRSPRPSIGLDQL